MQPGQQPGVVEAVQAVQAIAVRLGDLTVPCSARFRLAWSGVRSRSVCRVRMTPITGRGAALAAIAGSMAAMLPWDYRVIGVRPPPLPALGIGELMQPP